MTLAGARRSIASDKLPGPRGRASTGAPARRRPPAYGYRASRPAADQGSKSRSCAAAGEGRVNFTWRSIVASSPANVTWAPCSCYSTKCLSERPSAWRSCRLLSALLSRVSLDEMPRKPGTCLLCYHLLLKFSLSFRRSDVKLHKQSRCH